MNDVMTQTCILNFMGQSDKRRNDLGVIGRYGMDNRHSWYDADSLNFMSSQLDALGMKERAHTRQHSWLKQIDFHATNEFAIFHDTIWQLCNMHDMRRYQLQFKTTVRRRNRVQQRGSGRQ